MEGCDRKIRIGWQKHKILNIVNYEFTYQP